jgi:hypothetical protein
MSTCYRLGIRNPIQKVKIREQLDLQSPISCMCLCVGSNRKNDKYGGVWVHWGLTLKLDKGISTCYRLGMGSSVQKMKPVSNQTFRVQYLACACVWGSAGSNLGD